MMVDTWVSVSSHRGMMLCLNETGGYVKLEDYKTLEAEVERLKADVREAGIALQMAKGMIIRRDDDIAALVTALDEYHDAYLEYVEYRKPMGLYHPEEITPASRAVAEKWLKKKEEK